MAVFDVVMLVVIVAGMIWGALRGITWQLASILSLVLGYAVAFPASAQLAPHFPGQPLVARALAMLVLYVAVSAGVFGIAWSIRATLRRLRFEAYDRHLGMILGGFEGALLVAVITVFVVSLAPQTRTPILTSPSGKALDLALKTIQPALPQEVRGVLEPFWADLEGTSSDLEPEEISDTEAESAVVRIEPIEADESLGKTAVNADELKVDRNLIRGTLDRTRSEAARLLADELRNRLSRQPEEPNASTDQRR